MDSRPLCRLFFMLIWIFVFFLHCVCSQKDPPTLSLESRVFVTLKGKDLCIHCNLKKPANQSEDMLTCFDPVPKQIYSHSMSSTAGNAENHKLKLMLKHLNTSGEYYCKYQTAQVYWYLHVRDDGFMKQHEMKDNTLFIVVPIIAVLLIFSVVGSVYVFRGHWITKCRQTHGKGNQNKEEKKKGNEMKVDNVSEITDPSTSFYASLEPRPRSIYDELHHSPANKKPDQQMAKSKKKEPHQTKHQTTQHEDKGQFESVYENY